MPSLADLFVRVGIDPGPLKAGLKSVSDDFKAMDKEIRATEKAFAGFEKIGDRLSSVGAGLTAGVTLPLAAIGVAASKVAGDFQMSFNKVQAFGDITGASLDKLKAQALDLGAKTTFSAQQAADGMAVFASAGLKAEQIYAAMPGTLNLAAAGQLAVAEAATLAKDVLGQFGLEAAQTGRVADVMAQAAADASASLSEIATTLTYVGPVAHGAGQSLEETTAAIIALDAAGIRGEKAGTGLRGVLGSLLAPSKEAAKHLDELGISIADSTGKIRPLSDIMEQFRQQLGKVGSEAERQEIIFKVFGREAGNAAQVLINTGGPALDAFEKKLVASGGASEKMAKVLQQGLKGSLEQFKGSVETAAISLGTALLPVMGKALDLGTAFVNNFVLPAVKAFGELPTPVQAFALVLTGLAAAAGPVLFIMGQMISSVGSIASAFTAASGVMTKFPALAATLTSSLTVAAVAAGAFAAALLFGAQLYKLGEEISATSEKIDLNWNAWKRLKDALAGTDTKKAVDEIKYVGQACRESAADVLELELIWKNFRDQFTFARLIEALTGPLGALTASVRGLGDTFEQLGGKYVSMEKAATDSAKRLQTSVGTAMKAQLDAALADVEAQKKRREEIAKLTVGTDAYRQAVEKEKEAVKKAAAEAKIHEQAMKELGLSVDKAETKTRKWLDTQPVLAAQLRIVEGEYKKNIESLAALKLALERGTVGTVDLASASEKLDADLGRLGTSIKDLPQMPGYIGTIKELDELGKAYGRLRIKTTAELKAIAEQHLTDFKTIERSGTATAKVLSDAWGTWAEAAVEAARQAGEDVPIEIEGMLAASKRKMDTDVPKLKTPWQTLSGEVSTIITNLAQELAKMLFDGNLSFAEKMKGALKSLGEAVVSSFIQPATAAITGFITGVLADLIGGKGFGGVLGRIGDLGSGIAGAFSGLGGLSGGIAAGSSQAAAAGSQAVNSIVGGAGGAANAAASVARAASGALGMVNVASSVLSSVTDVLSFLGQRHIEKDVAAIEVTSRAIFAEIFNLRADSWDRETHLMKKLDDIWNSIWEAHTNDYVRQGDILDAILTKGDDTITAIRGIGSVMAAPITAVAESIEDQLSRARSELVGAQAGRGGLEALHRSFTSLDSLYARFLFEGPDLFAEALRVTGAAEADALAVGVSDSLKQAFSHLYGMIASGVGLEDHSLFRQLSTVMGGIQREMESLGDYNQLGDQVSSLERTIERLEAAKKEREKNTIGHLVDRVDHWGAGTVSLLSVIAEKITGVKASIDTGGGAPAAGGFTGGGVSSAGAAAISQVSARSAAIQDAMRQIVSRVDAVRALATGDYAPSAELVSLWTSTTRTAAFEYNHLAAELASLGSSVQVASDSGSRLLDVIEFQTNPILENIHTAVATRSGPTIIINNPQFKDRSDIDYAVEQISRNLR